jgi:hypothetical protein
MAQQDMCFCGQWTLPAVPQGQDRSPTQELFETHADVFAPSELVHTGKLFAAWNMGERSGDRPW